MRFSRIEQRQFLEVTRAAGRKLLKYFGCRLDIREKKGAGLVTQADLAAEAVAMRGLKRIRPDFDWITEETLPKGKGNLDGGVWIIDPLDGTTNFVHGFPMFCTTIAAQWKGELIAAATYHPVLDEMVSAFRGEGAFMNGKRIWVSGRTKVRDSLLTTGFTYRKDEGLHAEMVAFENLSRVARAVRRPGSAALDLAYVARGVFDGFWERRLSPWDVAAGALLVEEAGGEVTGFGKAKFSIFDGEILASNGHLHQPLLAVIRKKK